MLTRLLPGLVLLAWTSASIAEPYCARMPKPIKEGDTWYIPEEAFTKGDANEAISEIRELIANGWKGKDFDVHNPTVRIKGYLYRSYLDGYKTEFGKDDEIVKDEFCQFIRNEAYVEH